VPVLGSAPDQAPLAVHDVPSFAAHESFALWPSATDVGWTEIETVGGGALMPPPPLEPPPPQAESPAAKSKAVADFNALRRTKNRFHRVMADLLRVLRESVDERCRVL
jgi:hypothetical protein